MLPDGCEPELELPREDTEPREPEKDLEPEEDEIRDFEDDDNEELLLGE